MFSTRTMRHFERHCAIPPLRWNHPLHPPHLPLNMQYKTLGNTGLLVSNLCLGTMTFGGGEGFWRAIGMVDQAGADELIKASIEAGINFFDTADVYSDGESEKTLGQSLRNLN